MKKRTTIVMSRKNIKLLKALPIPASTFLDIITEEFFKKASIDELVKAYVDGGQEGVRRYIRSILCTGNDKSKSTSLENQEEKPKRKSIEDMFEGFL